jgi:hypothetical protein
MKGRPPYRQLGGRARIGVRCRPSGEAWPFSENVAYLGGAGTEYPELGDASLREPRLEVPDQMEGGRGRKR